MNSITVAYPTTYIKNKEIVQGFLGSIFIAICSLIWIPTIPIPITMQVFALFILTLQYSPRICLIATLYYLGEGTIGLPVFSGTVCPFWFMDSSAGYLFAFPFAGYTMAHIAYKSNSLFKQFSALIVGLLMIYFGGFVWLAGFIGWKESMVLGIFFFIPFDLMKMGLALFIINRLKIY